MDDQELLIGHFLESADHRVDAFERGEFGERNVIIALFRRAARNELSGIYRRIENFGFASEMLEAVCLEIFTIHVDFRNFCEVFEKILRHV